MSGEWETRYVKSATAAGHTGVERVPADTASVARQQPATESSSDSLLTDLQRSVELTHSGQGLQGIRERDRALRQQERAIEPGRLARAFRLVKEGRIWGVGPHEYGCIGFSGMRYDVKLDCDPECYCRDTEWRGRRVFCYHTLGGRILDGDVALMIQFGEWCGRSRDFRIEAGIETEEDAA